MKIEYAPIGDRVSPGDTCEKCGALLEILESAGDEWDTRYVGCPNGDEEDGHTHYRGLPAATLAVWGWKIETVDGDQP